MFLAQKWMTPRGGGLVTKDKKVRVNVNYLYEFQMFVSGTIYVKDGDEVVGTGYYNGTHWYGFSTVVTISCTFKRTRENNLTLAYADAYPPGWNPSIYFES